MSKHHQIVEVEWIDANFQSGWADDINDAESVIPALCTSIGYLLIDSTDRLVIGQSTNSEGNVGNIIAIPRSAVRSMTNIYRTGIG